MFASVKQYGEIPRGWIPKDRSEWPKPFTPMITVVVRLNPARLEQHSCCDKCGSLQILWMSRDRALILCNECKEMMVPVLEPIYGKMTGWSGYLVKVPKAMRLNTWDRPEVTVKEEPKPIQTREFPRKKRWVFSPITTRIAWPRTNGFI